jgi:NitT/TauT family transport system substrate-binding protein
MRRCSPVYSVAAWSLRSFAAFLALLLVSCGAEEEKRIRVAEQYGLAYAPVTIMKEYGLLEEALPDYEISWSRLTNAASIREAMLADRLDIGFMGVPPFLIGADQGMDWQIFIALSEVPVGLVAVSPELTTLKALSEADARIALPQPGSIQHILLALAARNHFGEAAHFDQQLVTLSHPDAAQALIGESGVDAHFATPPYLGELISDHGGHVVLSGTAAFGGRFTFIVGVGQSEYLYENPEAIAAFQRTVDKAIGLLDDEEAIDVLARAYGEEPARIREQLLEGRIEYGRSLTGVARFSSFMEEVGYLEEDLSALRTLVYSPNPRRPEQVQ